MVRKHITIAVLLMIILATIGIGSFVFSQDVEIVIYVSNQSFEKDPADIKVYIDGNLKIEDEYHVRSAHNWTRYTFSVNFGRHEIKVVCENNSLKTVEDSWFTSKRYVVINHFTELIDIQIMDNQPEFQ